MIYLLIAAFSLCDHSIPPPDPKDVSAEEWNGCWCSVNDGITWPARDDHLCYFEDKPKPAFKP